MSFNFNVMYAIFSSLEMPDDHLLAIDDVDSSHQFCRIVSYILSCEVEDTLLQASFTREWNRPDGSGFSTIIEMTGELGWDEIPI